MAIGGDCVIPFSQAKLSLNKTRLMIVLQIKRIEQLIERKNEF
jgi:hypothetical protein